MRPEARLLLHHLRRGAGRTAHDRAPPPASDVDWEAVAREAERHRVAPLLHAALRARSPAAPAAPPDRVAALLERRYACSALRSRWIHADLTRVLGALRDHDLPVIVLKGAYLAETVYDDRALRPMADLDLLLRPMDVAPAEAVLRGLGYAARGGGHATVDYAAHHHASPLFHPAAVPVELHRRLGPHPGFADPGGLWARARPAEIAHVPVLALAPEDLLVHLCVHVAYNHRFEARLLHLVDVAATVARFDGALDWRRVASIAREAGVGRFVYCTLQVANDLLGLDVSPGALGVVGHRRQDVDIVAALREFVLQEDGEAPDVYRSLQRAGSLVGRLRVVARALVPAAARLRAVHPWPADHPVGPAHYLSYILSRLRRHRVAAVEILRGSERVRAARARERGRLVIDRWIDGDPPRPRDPS